MSTDLTSVPTGSVTELEPEVFSASEAVWHLLDHPFRPVDATRSMFGLSPAAARYVVARDLLTRDETLGLLDAGPDLLRQMSNRLAFGQVRAVGAVLGPIQWHSTITARAAAGFPEDLFICETPYRDFDVPENQLLKFVLKHLVDSGRYLSTFARASFDDDRNALARERAREAKRFLELRPFDGVKPLRDPATIRQTKRSKNRTAYRTVIDFLPSLARPLHTGTLRQLADRRTASQHKMILAVLAALRQAGIEIRPFVAGDGMLTAGPMQYRHPGARGLPGAHGIRVGDMLLDVPDVTDDHHGAIRRLGQRSGSLSPHIVETVDDVRALTDQILAAATSNV